MRDLTLTIRAIHSVAKTGSMREKNMRRVPLLVLGLVAVFLVWEVAWADQIKFKADLSAGPSVTSPGKGTASATLDTATKTLAWTVDYSGLSGPATAAHIHGPADPGANAGIVVPFTGDLGSPIKGSATLTDAQIAQLEAGKWYVNIHTAANKGGEIRGQLTRAS
jgi:CHRD domain